LLETLLRDGWAYHDTESERLAGQLEAVAAVASDQLIRFLQLSNHTLGENLADWQRARRLAEQALDGRVPTAETHMAWARLSVARFLAGDAALAIEAELTCLAAAGDGFRASLIEARFLLVAAMLGSKRVADAAAIYNGALALARQAGDAAPYRSVAVASNNLAFEMVEAVSRSPEQQALMTIAADAAHEFWLRCGDWINEERALYLKALVANELGVPNDALTHANAALAIIDANGARPIDAAVLRLARSRAFALLGDADGRQHDITLDDLAAARSPDAALKAWFAEQRAKAVATAPRDFEDQSWPNRLGV
jgi:hypothetical protein